MVVPAREFKTLNVCTCQKPNPHPMANVQVAVEIGLTEPPKKHRKVTLGGVLGGIQGQEGAREGEGR